MYGGLFGDLPATKKDGKASGEGESTDASAAATKSEGETGDEAATTYSSNKKPAAATAPGFLFPPRAQKKAKTSTGNNATTSDAVSRPHQSIVQSLGKVGTSMAFVPQAALKKKKPNLFAKLLEAPNDVPPAVTASNAASDMKDPPPLSKQEERAAAASTLTMSTTVPPHEMTVTTTVVSKQPADANAVIHIHPQEVRGDQQGDDSQQPIHTEFLLHETQQHLDDNDKDDDEITDPYDPYVPNDLLQYWEKQAASQERARLEQEAREALERQRVLRAQLERERQELLQKGAAGGHDASAAAAAMGGMGRGRGRGRGVSNLPAWLIEKQRKEAAEGLGKSDGGE
jgi:hypothetical protein